MKGHSEFVSFILLILGPALVTSSSCSKRRCEWEPWNNWSDCDAECAGGSRDRDRYLCCKADLDIYQCIEDCGLDLDTAKNLFYDSGKCNEHCYNGGTYVASDSGYCNCSDGYKGTCCKDVVTCQEPSSVSHGSFSGKDFTFGGKVTYTCDPNYNMTDPSKAMMTCSKGGFWSGSAPTCLNAMSCESEPCKNGARCENLLGDYRCHCTNGWTGMTCDLDIQPPVINGCPKDTNLTTSNMTVLHSWTEPNITDPHGTTVEVTKNYNSSRHEFPWGEFEVKYHGVKPSNGLSVECGFKISVKPNACQKLSPPENGNMICNGWRQEYTQICMFECKTGYILPPGFEDSDVFVCGATGNWLPARRLTKCISQAMYPKKKGGKVSTCTDEKDRDKLAELYISRLKESAFKTFCKKYRDECISKNVVIEC